MYQKFTKTFSQKLSSAAITDTTPPTFTGVSSATANNNGSITVAWGSVTEAVSLPVEFLVYVALGDVDAATLFVPGNLTKIVPSGATSTKVYTLADQTTYLAAGQTYTFGVRAKDAVGNINQNVAVETAVSTGVLTDGLAEYVTQLTGDISTLEIETQNVKNAAIMVLSSAN